MEIQDLKHLGRLDIKDESLFQHPDYQERAEVCFESRDFFGRTRTTRTQLYVKGISFILDRFNLEAFKEISYDSIGRSTPQRRVPSIPLESISEYISLVER